ncbi:MAG: hypothetical protein GC160_15945 [Acidobacteria bacterium]|nr:hypothetical protein [Acidobacteriota bacterium]
MSQPILASLTRRACLGALAGLAVLRSADAANRSQLAGQWLLNHDESDDPKQKIQEALDGAGKGRRGGLARLRGGSDRMQQALERMAEAAENLSIQVEGDNVTLTAGGHSRTLVANGETKRQEGERGSVETRTQWQGDSLVTTAKTDRGVEATTTHSLSSDGNRLVIDRRIEGGRLPQTIELRMVYDRTSGSSVG